MCVTGKGMQTPTGVFHGTCSRRARRPKYSPNKDCETCRKKDRGTYGLTMIPPNDEKLERLLYVLTEAIISYGAVSCGGVARKAEPTPEGNV